MLFVGTITFMSVDWVMSLDPHWYSTIFGVLTLGGQGLSTMAFTILMLALLVRFEPMSQVATAEQVPRPRQADVRVRDAVGVLLGLAVAHHLVGEPAGRDSRSISSGCTGRGTRSASRCCSASSRCRSCCCCRSSFKRNPNVVKWIALFILVMRVVDITWTIGPVFRHEGSSLSWVDFAVVLGIGGLWLFLFFRNLAGRALVPARDPYFKEAMAHGGH